MTNLITICTYTYNEEKNIELFYSEVKNIFEKLNHEFELVISDNCSQDETVNIIKKIAKKDKRVKLILNEKNVGSEINSYTAWIHASGEIAIALPSDLQIPLSVIEQLIHKYEKTGSNIIYLQYSEEENSFVEKKIRSILYKVFNLISENKIPLNCEGSGLYTKEVIEKMKNISDRTPFMRSIGVKLGFDYKVLRYTKKNRKYGKTSNSLGSFINQVIEGYIQNSTSLLKFMFFLGIFLSLTCFIFSIYYLIKKILFWQSFSLGIAPILVGFFLFSGIQISFLGLIGYYVLRIINQDKSYPRNIIKEKINFD